MKNFSRHLFVFAALGAGSLPVTPALAQYYGGAAPQPLYPYAVQQPQRPYAIQVAPNTYVIQQPAETRVAPKVRSRSAHHPVAEKPAKRFDRPHKPVDHKLVEELRRRHQSGGGSVVNTKQIVREAPIVRETRRIVDDPPRVITRQHTIEDQPDGSRITTVEESAPTQSAAAPRANRQESRQENREEGRGRDDNKKRVIQADAEVTVLGPDRMTFRLFRKGQGPKANARAN